MQEKTTLDLIKEYVENHAPKDATEEQKAAMVRDKAIALLRV